MAASEATNFPLSPTRVAGMQKWLHDCDVLHRGCDTNREFLYDFRRRPPRRFIEVGEPGQTTSIRLVEMDSTPKKPYAALSYCWGPTEVNYTTTISHIEEHKRQLPWSLLPKTVQDAIVVTQLLGIPYLWIDALCIVQRSEVQTGNGVQIDNGDWAEEASKMAGIYRHARVTLAALSASSSAQGFLSTIDQQSPPEALSCDREIHDYIQDTPHAQRGWTFQELLLSTRIIYFYDGWMVWECRSAKGLENTSLKDMTGGVFVKELRDVKDRSLPNANQLTWWSWVYAYTSRALTYSSDRPAAVYGVIDHYAYRAKDGRMAGLWISTLLGDLLWRAVRPTKRIPTTLVRMPTWSWLSIEGTISAPRSVDLGNSIFRPVAKLIEVRDPSLSFTRKSDRWIGCSTIVLQGKLQPAQVSKEQGESYDLRVIVDGQPQEPQHCWIDCSDEVPTTGQVFCFWIGFLYGYPGLEQYATREALVLIPVGENTYHRIGACKVRAEKFFAGSQITRWEGPSSDGRRSMVAFAPIDPENALKLGFLDDDVTVILR